MTLKEFKNISSTIPLLPGVYQFVSAEDIILYVGKAKSLRKRLASYFSESKNKAFKTRSLVKNAHHIKFTIVDTEQDALLLENTLIKKLQPRYNVMLKDGKSYTYICIKNERFPRVFLTRRVIKDGSTYFGPYTSKYTTKQILDLLKNLFALRTCNFALSPENIQGKKIKVCLEYHIKNCQGPCEGLESEASYNDKIKQIKNILRGHFASVKEYIKEQMRSCADHMDYEQAEVWKNKLLLFEDYQSKSTVVSHLIKNVDVFSIVDNEVSAYVNYLKVVNGALLNTYSIELKKNLDDEKETLLRFAITSIQEKYGHLAEEIIVPFGITTLDPSIKVTVPQIGDKKKLLELSEKNAKYMLFQSEKAKVSQTTKKTSAERILKTLQQDLQMEEVPFQIECFDNSNIQGAHPVASCVVFKNAKPAKKDYRHFHIKTVVGANDFASMEEVVGRRYRRLVKEDKPLPQLIIIDGGKGQLSSAHKILKELAIDKKITVIGIAKRLEEIYFPGDSIPLYINKKSESLKLIQQLRNEAHRFAITFHRQIRSKEFIKPELESIPGIGKKTSEKLLSRFKSVSRIKKASLEDLQETVGPNAARLVVAHFQS